MKPVAVPDAFAPIPECDDAKLADSLDQALWITRGCVVALGTMPTRAEAVTEDARDALSFLAAKLFDQIDAKVSELHRRHSSEAG